MKKLFIFILFVSVAGCISAPNKKDYTLDSCFAADRCLYVNQKNPDKSICMGYMSECTSFSKYEYCKRKENRIDSVTFKECWLYLNQK